LSGQDNFYIARIAPEITYLNDCIRDIQHIFKNLPNDLISLKLNGCADDISKQFGVLLSTYEEFRTELRNTLVDVRRSTRESIEINNVLFNRHYSLLRKPAIDVFYSKVQQLLEKIKLIERFNDEKITYINALDILQYQSRFLTLQDIDEILKDHFSKQHTDGILWYASDRLKREKTDEWDQFYRQVTSERQQQATQQTPIIYIDFSQCSQKLENSIIRRLPILPSSESRHNHPRGKILNQINLSHFLSVKLHFVLILTYFLITKE
jgi:hypothetical protein